MTGGIDMARSGHAGTASPPATAGSDWARQPLITGARDGFRADFLLRRGGAAFLFPRSPPSAWCVLVPVHLLFFLIPSLFFYIPLNLNMWNSRKVGILGGGQLGRMLVESANRLNIQCNVLDAENSPAKQISSHDDHVTGSFKEREAVRELAKSCDVVTAEIEHVDTYALEEIASQVRIEPSWQAIRTIQNKYNQKEHLRKYGIPMAEHRELAENTPEALAKVGEELGYPLMLKSKTMAYDGRGESPVTQLLFYYLPPTTTNTIPNLPGNFHVRGAHDIPEALEFLKGRPLYAEKWAYFKMVCPTPHLHTE